MSADGRISEQDIEDKLRAFQGDVQQTVDDKKSMIAIAGGGVVVALLLVFFVLGKRSGTKKSTLVEIKRF